MAQHPPLLADGFAALRQGLAQPDGAHPWLIALVLRLLSGLESLARRWQAPPRRRRHPLAGKGPIPRDWMVRCHPGRGCRRRFLPPVLRPQPRLLRTPPEPAPAQSLLA